MVEILLSLVFVVAAIALAIWPYDVLHDHNRWSVFDSYRIYVHFDISVQFHLAMRFHGAQDVAAAQRAWPRLTRVLSAAFSMCRSEFARLLVAEFCDEIRRSHTSVRRLFDQNPGHKSQVNPNSANKEPHLQS
jgi:hypothetical protein